MDLFKYHSSDREKERIADLMKLSECFDEEGFPLDIETALDVGARDGFISRLLAERFSRVTSLDLEKPTIDHQRITCVKGDITSMDFPDNSFDLIVCTEVLEHIPTKLLSKACDELIRVSKRFVLIGVPYKQDIRVGRTTCSICGNKNPPWGHVNIFDYKQLQRLFPLCKVVNKSFVGTTTNRTNFISCLLNDMAGNPNGTYSQEEPCVHCNARLKPPNERKNGLVHVLTKASSCARKVQSLFLKPQPNWLHVLFEKSRAV